MGEKEMKNVLKTGKIQSRSGRTYFADASHISKSSGTNANKYALPGEKKCFVEFKIKNEVEICGPNIVDSKYNRIGGGIEYWVDEGISIEADIVSYGRLP